MQASSSRNKYLDSFDALNPASKNGDAIDEWLNSPPLSDIKNPLQYWTAMGANGHPLARMAKDFLSVPGMYEHQFSSTFTNSLYVATSTDVERAFSRGGLTASKMRHSLSDQSTRAATVLGAWCDLPGAIPREEIAAGFRDKNKRPKGSSSNNATSVALPESSDVTVAL
jgi:hypothetical protein